jgi:hypothetical protein
MRGQGSAEPVLVKDILDVVGAEGFVGESGPDGLEEFLGAIGVGETKETDEVGVEIDLGVNEAVEESFGWGAEGEELGDEALVSGAASGLQQGSGVIGFLEIAILVEGAGMGSDEVGFVIDADLGRRGLEGERLAGELGRNGVGVALELDTEGDGGLDGKDDGSVVRFARERDEEGGFFLKEVDRPLAGGPVKTQVGHVVSPLGSGGVHLVEVAEFAAQEKGVFDIADPGLDPTLFVRSSPPTERGLEGVKSRKGHKARIEADLVGHSLQHNAPEVVIENLGWMAAEEAEGVLVAAQEFLQVLAHGELTVQKAAVGEHHDETGKPAGVASDRDEATTGPVDLCGFAGCELQREESVGLRRADFLKVVLEDADTAGVALAADFLQESRRRELGELLQSFPEVRLVRFEDRWTWPALLACSVGLLFQRPADRFPVQSQMLRNL